MIARLVEVFLCVTKTCYVDFNICFFLYFVTGDEAFSFTTLMHTYFRVEDIGKARVKGLKGLKYDDKV